MSGCLMPFPRKRLKAIQHPHGPREKQGGRGARSIPRQQTTTTIIIIMTTMSQNYVTCTFARPAGTRTNLVVLYVAPNQPLEGETVLCNLAPGQEWITELNQGDLVYVRNHLREGRKNDYLGDACANSKQPLFHQCGKEQPLTPVKTFADLEAAYISEGRDLPGLLRIDTYLSNPEHIAILKKLDTYCSKKEAGHLLLKYAISSLPSAAKQMEALELYDWLNNF